MAQRWWFPFAVFAVVLLATFGAIAVLDAVTRPGEIPVSRGVVTFADAERGFGSAAVDRYALEFLRTTRVRGVAIAITGDDEVLHTAGYGHGVDGAPLTADSPMPIASLSKSMTAAAVMRLVEDEAIELDAPAHAYLPAFNPSDARGAALTVRQLLNQSSGLPEVSRGEAQPPRSVAELIARLNGEPFAAQPGAAWAYDNANYILLAALTEEVAQEPFAALLRHKVLEPIGMASSATFFDAGDPSSPVARGYRLLYGAPLPARAPEGQVMLGAGGVVSTANDLARWLVVQSNAGRTVEGAQILSAESIAAMHTPSAGPGYGFGWRTGMKSDGNPFVFHVGRNIAYVAYQAVFPDSGFSYAIAWNTLHPFGAEQAAFIEGIYAILSGAEPAPIARVGFVADGLAAVMTALVLSIGVVGVVRAGDLVRRRSPPIVVLRTAPYVLAGAAAVLFPSLWFGVSWGETFAVWPAFAILLGATALAAIAVSGARSIRLYSLQVRSRP